MAIIHCCQNELMVFISHHHHHHRHHHHHHHHHHRCIQRAVACAGVVGASCRFGLRQDIVRNFCFFAACRGGGGGCSEGVAEGVVASIGASPVVLVASELQDGLAEALANGLKNRLDFHRVFAGAFRRVFNDRR